MKLFSLLCVSLSLFVFSSLISFGSEKVPDEPLIMGPYIVESAVCSTMQAAFNSHTANRALHCSLVLASLPEGWEIIGVDSTDINWGHLPSPPWYGFSWVTYTIDTHGIAGPPAPVEVILPQVGG